MFRTHQIIPRLLVVSLLALSSISMSAEVRDLEFGAVSGQTGRIRPLGPDLLEVAIDGVVSITGLGNAIVSGDQLVDFSDNPAGDIEGTGSFFFPDAGDRIDFEFEGESTLPDVAQIINFFADLEFLGGTGRFAKATGAGHFRGTFRFGVPEVCDAVAGTGMTQYAGTLYGVRIE